MKKLTLSTLLISCLFILTAFTSCKCGTYTQKESKKLPVVSVPQDWSTIVEQSISAVVKIKIFQVNITPELVGGGTGFLVSSDGLILTAAHVTSHIHRFDNAEIWVYLKDGRNYKVVDYHSHTRYDISTIKIDETNLQYLSIENKHEARTGESVIFIGHSIAFEWYTSSGIISKCDSITAQYPDPWMQVTIPINPGNSGGPILNQYGHVVGIVKATMPTMNGVSVVMPRWQIVAALEDFVE